MFWVKQFRAFGCKLLGVKAVKGSRVGGLRACGCRVRGLLRV